MPMHEAAKLASMGGNRPSVLPFPVMRRVAAHVPACHARFTALDRITAHHWQQHAAESGYAKVEFGTVDDPGDAELGEYLLIYRRDIPWAQWGVNCVDGGYEAWSARCNAKLGDAKLGRFSRLQDALDAIIAAPI